MRVKLKTLEEIMNHPYTKIITYDDGKKTLQFTFAVSNIPLRDGHPKLKLLGKIVKVERIEAEGRNWWVEGWEFADWQFTKVDDNES